MLDKLIYKFILQNKRLGTRLKIIFLPRDRGGLVLPNFYKYYWAAQLTTIVAWINNNKETGWVQIEQDTAKGVFLSVENQSDQEK